MSDDGPGHEERIGRELRALVLSWNMRVRFVTALKQCEPNPEVDRSWGEIARNLQTAQVNAMGDAFAGNHGLRLLPKDED